MHPHLITLYNLRLADERGARAKKRLQGLDWGETQHRAVVALRGEAANLAAKKTSTEKALRDAERDLASAEDRIQKTEKRLGAGVIHNVHEMESTERELEALRIRRSTLEETALVLMEELEKVPAQALAIRRKEQAFLKEMERLRLQSTEEKAKLEKEIEAAGVKANELSGQLPADVLTRYKRIRDHSNGLAVSRVISGACGECHVAVSPAVVDTILKGPQLIPCQNCARILYTDSEAP